MWPNPTPGPPPQGLSPPHFLLSRSSCSVLLEAQVSVTPGVTDRPVTPYQDGSLARQQGLCLVLTLLGGPASLSLLSVNY